MSPENWPFYYLPHGTFNSHARHFYLKIAADNGGRVVAVGSDLCRRRRLSSQHLFASSESVSQSVTLFV